MKKKDTIPQRALLIETGVRLFRERGYTATGVREIASTADVPQGSFTNHFRSKERFGSEVLDHYAERLDQIMRATLLNGARSPSERLQSYFDTITQSLQEHGWEIGCLIPDLAGEASTQSEILRERLRRIIAHQADIFAQVLRELVDEDSAEDYAAFILAAWHGTLLRTKVDRNVEAINRFRRMLYRMVGLKGSV